MKWDLEPKPKKSWGEWIVLALILAVVAYALYDGVLSLMEN